MDQGKVRWGSDLSRHGVFEYIVSLENLFSAWREFRYGKRNKPEIQQFEFNLEDNLFQLHQVLTAKTYRPDQYVSFFVQDPKLRHIHKASVRDRVLHHAIFRVLYPIFDKDFIFDVYSSRVNKGTHAAVNRLEKFIAKASENNRRNILILKCDVSKFFDSIDHELLFGFIQRRIFERDALGLIWMIIKSFEKRPGKGLPLGNVTSQLFANIYLHELDVFAKRALKIKYYLRYCDDFIVVDQRDFSEVIEAIRNFLSEELKLTLHPKKIIIRKHSQGIDFLGYVCRPYHRLLRTKTKHRIIRLVNEKNKQSYHGMLKHCAGHTLEQYLT